MKSAIIALAALVSATSAFAANRVSLTAQNGVQTLSVSGAARPGVPTPGLLSELPALMMKAKRVLSVKRYPDASVYKGRYVSGNTTCPAAACFRTLIIEQKAGFGGPGTVNQRIMKVAPDRYEITGEAARELYDAIVDAGVRPRPSPSKMPSKIVSGDSFSCSATPLNGMHYKCTVSANSDLR
ncbi:MAG: hypothetical protein JST04_08315 [Bdellovibrionales bacterium]|nr:hypothetical protein [Bdellovibrionales bacterium]